MSMSRHRRHLAGPAGLFLAALSAALAMVPVLAQPAAVPAGAAAAAVATRPAPAAVAPAEESGRLARDVPQGPAASPPQAAPAGAPAGSAQPTPADPAIVARELGVEPEPAAGPVAPELPDTAGTEGAADPLRPQRKAPVKGLVSVGVGSHDSYHVGLGISTEVAPNTTFSASIISGRWDTGWGWWSRDPFPPYRTFPELQP